MKKLIIVTLMILSFVTSAFCNPPPLPAKEESLTYYVDVNSGSDGYPGTKSQPFKTIKHASTVLQPGDTAIILSLIHI